MVRYRELLGRANGQGDAGAKALFESAINALAASRWHMGENPNKKKYCDWVGNLCNSYETMDKWVQEALDKDL